MSESCQWAFPDFPYPNIAIDSVGTNTGSADRTNQPQSNPSSQPQPNPSSQNPTNDSKEDNENDADNDSGGEFADPRNASKTRASHRKASEINLAHRLIRCYLQQKGVIPITSQSSIGKGKGTHGKKPEPPSVPTMPPAVDPATLEAYCRQHNGPTRDDMPVSWTNSMQHPWNQRVIQLLAAEFKSNIKACKYQVLTSLPPDCDGVDFVFSAIEAKLNRCQSILRTAIRTMTQVSNLSSAEVAGLFANQYKESLVRSRRNERKRNLYIRRGDIIQDALDSPWSKDPGLWGEIQAVFDLLDEKDMSSDETETEALFGACKETRRIQKQWIDKRISKIMNYIDQQYSNRTINGTLKRGNAPLRRIWESKTVNSSCQPKPGLPKNVYSADLKPEVLKTLKPLEPIMLPNIPEFAA